MCDQMAMDVQPFSTLGWQERNIAYGSYHVHIQFFGLKYI
jgi:hypothetical protein